MFFRPRRSGARSVVRAAALILSAPVLSTIALSTLVLSTLSAGVAHAQVASAPFNVTNPAYGANGNDTADDTQGIQNAINAVPSSGGEVYIPAGTYYLSGPLTVSNKPIAFRGEGARVTNLIRRGAGDGIVFTSSSSVNQGFAVRSMSFLREDGGGGAAISGSWPTPGAYASLGPVTATIHDVHISAIPWDYNGRFWRAGIVLHNVTNAKIYAFNIHMTQSWPHAGQPDIETGIDIKGASINVQISDGDVSRMHRGVTVRDQSEAIFIKDVETGEGEYGFHLWNAGRGSVISGCHANMANGIRVENTSDVTISNNLLFGNFGAEKNAIKIVNQSWAHGARFRITGNVMHALSPMSNFGIVIDGYSTESLIQGNSTSGMDVGIWLFNPNTTHYIVSGNRNWASPNTFIDGGAGTLNVDNH